MVINNSEGASHGRCKKSVLDAHAVKVVTIEFHFTKWELLIQNSSVNIIVTRSNFQVVVHSYEVLKVVVGCFILSQSNLLFKIQRDAQQVDDPRTCYSNTEVLI